METTENIQTIIWLQDVNLICVAATSFPDGILESHQHLHSLFRDSKERQYFGISRPENKTINYWAATSQLLPQDIGKEGTEIIVLKKGRYVSTTVHDFMNDVTAIENAFMQLLKQPNLDPEGYCVEIYLNQQDVQCMIRLMDFPNS